MKNRSLCFLFHILRLNLFFFYILFLVFFDSIQRHVESNVLIGDGQKDQTNKQKKRGLTFFVCISRGVVYFLELESKNKKDL